MPDTIEALVDAMTLEEQVSLLSGIDAWTTPAIRRLGVGKLRVTDGPNGARGEKFVGGTKSAAFPVGIALGASWNVELLREVGAALAREVKAKGAHMSLAPTVNMHRSVTNGRNFECYSEDPILTAELASAYIQGLQGEGVAATIKHFAGNESRSSGRPSTPWSRSGRSAKSIRPLSRPPAAPGESHAFSATDAPPLS